MIHYTRQLTANILEKIMHLTITIKQFKLQNELIYNKV